MISPATTSSPSSFFQERMVPTPWWETGLEAWWACEEIGLREEEEEEENEEMEDEEEEGEVDSYAHERIHKLHRSCIAEIPFFLSAQHFLSVNKNRKQ